MIGADGDMIRYGIYRNLCEGRGSQPAALGLDLGTGPKPSALLWCWYMEGMGCGGSEVSWASAYERKRPGAKELFVCSRTGSQFQCNL